MSSTATCRASSFAELPMVEGELREGVARRRGYHMPMASDYEGGANSGQWLAVADPDATVTAPGVASHSAVYLAGAGCPEVKENAVLLGQVFVTRFGECALVPSAAGDLVKNARRYSERYALGAGFRRCSSRLGAPNARASRFESDVPRNMAFPGWLLFPAFSDLS